MFSVDYQTLGHISVVKSSIRKNHMSLAWNPLLWKKLIFVARMISGFRLLRHYDSYNQRLSNMSCKQSILISDVYVYVYLPPPVAFLT